VPTTLKMNVVPGSIVHLLDPKRHPLVAISVQNGKPDRIRRVRVTTFVDGYSASAIDSVELAKAAPAQVFQQLPTFFPDRLATVHELTRATVNTLVEDLDGKVELQNTTAVWLAPDDATRADLKAAGMRASEGVVGLRNLAVVALPLVAMCDSRDLGGVVDSKNLGRSTMILYDRYPGGLGYSERGFANMPQLLLICLEMVRDCPCEDGCPSCVGLPNLRPAIHSDPDLTRGHPMPDKQATIRLLELLTAADVQHELKVLSKFSSS